MRDYAVVVFAADRERWTFPSRFLALARPDQEGRFDVRKLPPENYLVVAVPFIRGNEWEDPEFLERVRGDATPVLLLEGERRALDLILKRFPDDVPAAGESGPFDRRTR